MALTNKLGITNSAQLAETEERLTKKKALELFESDLTQGFPVGKYDELAMERSPVRDTEIKALLKSALTDKIADRDVYMKGIDASYNYEGYSVFKAENLSER